MPELILVSEIITDADTQSRVKLDETTVNEYLALLLESEKWPFSPLVVFRDGDKIYLADGFHRMEAVASDPDYEDAMLPCEVREGDASDARFFSMTANDKHGLRPTQADKRKSVEWCLDNCPEMTQEEIAEKAGVTRRTVQNIVYRRTKKANKQAKNEAPGRNFRTVTNTHPNISNKEENGQAIESEEDEPETQESEQEEPAKIDPIAAAKSVVHQLRDRLARAICDYHQVNPYKAQRDRLVAVVQAIEVWEVE